MAITKRDYYYTVEYGDSLTIISEKHDMPQITGARKIWDNEKNENMHSKAVMPNKREVKRQLHLGGNRYRDYSHKQYKEKEERDYKRPDQVILYTNEKIWIPGEEEKKEEEKDASNDLIKREITKDEMTNGLSPKPDKKYELIFPSITVRLDMDINESSVQDDKYTLYGVKIESNNVEKQYYKKTLNVTDAVDNDGISELHFIGTAKNLLYSLELDNGDEKKFLFEKRTYFENIE
ncbi:MAG: hypothetical protein GY754_29775 [bacterium]|nr:hypothetical protein [bacterium]